MVLTLARPADPVIVHTTLCMCVSQWHVFVLPKSKALN